MTQVVTPGDIDIAWRTVFMEAANQGYSGMLAVAWVLKNRRDYRKNDRWATLAQTCLDWLQFSGWRENDPTFAPSQKADLDSVGLLCLRAVTEALTSNDDPTKGARHYFNPAIVKPSWAKDVTPCYTHRDHVFFNNIA
jgi:spore germination cell wall hydrolase CwlJ-like protein